MRDILFRGKRKDNNEWVYGYVVIDKAGYGFNDTDEDIYYIAGNSECYIEVIPETIGQYTGLDDKKGVKIFRGDKIEAFCNFKEKYMKGTVEFDMFNGLELKTMIDDETWHFDHLEDIEVIGNIHDNPELLDKEVK